MTYPIHLPFNLEPSAVYQTNTDVVFVCEDHNTVWLFYWDGASVSWHKVEGWPKFISPLKENR